MPNIPRLARPKRTQAASVLLALPRISPEWELDALQALIKPQLKTAILHRSATQKILAGLREQVERIVGSVATRIGYRPQVHWPLEGDYVFAIEVSTVELPEAKGLALALSGQLPGTWLVLGKLFLRDGRFYRRKRGYKLKLVLAGNIHLSRPIRSALRGVL